VLAADANDWTFERHPEAASFAPPTPFPLHHLIESLDSRQAPAANIRDAQRSLRVALAAYQAAREGKAVRIG
jgi:predicted dehydrogenase